MKVVLIGSGNAATVLGKLMINAGHNIMQVAGRNASTLSKLAATLNADAIVDFEKMNRDADIYIICVSDDAVANIAQQIKFHPKILVHTSGSVSMNVLKDISEKYGVIYPLQSLRKELETLPETPLLIEGNDERTKNELVNFSKTFSKNVTGANEEQRMNMHVAAVVVSNFTNHLFTLTKEFCEAKKIDFKILFPLIKETVLRIEKNDPAEMQTGPAYRNNEATMEKNLILLEDNFYLKEIYKLMSESILKWYKKNPRRKN